MAAQGAPLAPFSRLPPPLARGGRLPWRRLTLSGAREAIRGLIAHKLRSALALLAIMVGVAAALLALATRQQAEQATAGRFAAIGANTITVQGFVMPANAAPSAPGQATMVVARAGTATLTLQDVQTLRQLPHVIAASPDEPALIQAVAGDHTLQMGAYGAYPDLQVIRGYTLRAGSFFSVADVEDGATVAVLGTDVAATLFPGESAVGQQVRLNNVNFTVVGVLNVIGAPAGIHEVINNVRITPDGSAIVPLTTWQQRLQGQQPGQRGGSGPLSGGGGPKGPPGANVIVLQGASLPPGQRLPPGATFGMVQVEADTTGDVAIVKQEITQALERNHHIAPGGKDDFSMDNFLAGARAEGQALGTVELAMAIMASVALLIGGAGVANVMLAAVSERRREIGIRLAVGARPRDVLLQFLIEAVTLSLVGGALGVVAGLILVLALRRLLVGASALAFSPIAPVVVLGTAILVGLLFGVYPAARAARLDPIAALR